MEGPKDKVFIIVSVSACWVDENAWTQQFYWNDQGIPNFGKPIKAGIPLEIPFDNIRKP